MAFSVLMSVYAKEKPEYLSECLQSLVLQTLLANEVVLVEDGPIPCALSAVIEGYRDKLNIVTVKLLQNSGLAVALNEGLTHCQHALVARMDADDICLSDRFLKQTAFFDKDPSLDVVGSFVVEIDEQGKKGALRSMPVTHDEIVNSLWACPVIHPGVMFKRDKINQVGGYNIALRRRQDYDLWFRCAEQGLKFHNIPTPLLLYRFTQNTYAKQSVKLAFEQAIIGFKGASLLNLPIWKRVACFVPFIRSLLPSRLQYLMYLALRRFDPRKTKLDLKQ